MRKYVAIGTLAALALGAQSAAAEGFSYNLIEGSYSFGDVEDIDLNGFGVQGSAELTSNLSVFGGLRNLEFDDFGDPKLNTLNLGLGVNWPLTDNLDLTGGASFERMKITGAGSESGFGVGAGLRGRVANSLELTAGIKYTDIGDFGDAFTYSAGARWYFTPNFAIGADYNRLDLGDSNAKGNLWTAVLRYDFGDRM